MSDRENAKKVLAEIVRCSNGLVDSKTRLFKLFYLAHLIYAKREPDYLSNWPIVRMPYGPGIHDAEVLIGELQSEGVIAVRNVSIGPYNSKQYTLETDEIPELSLEAIEAIRDAVQFASDKTASDLSELTHQYSNSWKNTKDGEELNIYVDLLTEEEYNERMCRITRSVDDFRTLGEI